MHPIKEIALVGAHHRIAIFVTSARQFRYAAVIDPFGDDDDDIIDGLVLIPGSLSGVFESAEDAERAALADRQWC
jgi:hypothetical protein